MIIAKIFFRLDRFMETYELFGLGRVLAWCISLAAVLCVIWLGSFVLRIPPLQVVGIGVVFVLAYNFGRVGAAVFCRFKGRKR